MSSLDHKPTAPAAVIIIITLLFFPLLLTVSSNSFAQVQEEGEEGAADFLPYQDLTYDIFMQYPSNWTASTSGLEDYTDLIAFYSPLQNVSDSFPARLKISVIAYSQNVSLPEYTDSILTILENQSSAEQVVDVRSSSSDVTVAGYPGYRVVLASQLPFENSTLIFYHMNTWTTIGNRVYILTYEGEESKFNQHLPEVSVMLESLRIQQQQSDDDDQLTDPFGAPTAGDDGGGDDDAQSTEPFGDIFGSGNDDGAAE